MSPYANQLLGQLAELGVTVTIVRELLGGGLVVSVQTHEELTFDMILPGSPQQGARLSEKSSWNRDMPLSRAGE